MSSKRTPTVLAVLLVTFALVAGCTVGEGDISLAHVTASRIEGDATILSVEVEPGAHKRVFGPFARYGGLDSAEVRVDADTRVLRQTTKGSEPATLDEVISATYLNVRFMQPATSSDPVEATAEQILIVEPGHSGR